jgi:8-oxo-dGTP pyrophosphatase MutT (NUDIX family)
MDVRTLWRGYSPPTSTTITRSNVLSLFRKSALVFSLALLTSTLLISQLIARVSPPTPVPWLPSDTAALSQSIAALHALSKSYTVVSDTVVYSRYARMYARTIRRVDGSTVDYDVLGRVWKNDSFRVVSVVPFSRVSNTFTLIREYNIAHDMHVYAFPQGCVETSKHASPHAAAEAELDEEAQLRCSDGKLISLLEYTARGMPQDKYQRESVFPFLCTAAVRIPLGRGRERDSEEDSMDVVRGVGVKELKGLMRAGLLQVSFCALSEVTVRTECIHLTLLIFASLGFFLQPGQQCGHRNACHRLVAATRSPACAELTNSV